MLKILVLLLPDLLNMIREITVPRNKLIDTLEDAGKVSGFVSPADDYIKRRLHIAQRIVADPTNTFYFEADDDQMRYYGIFKNTIIVVDRSIQIKSNMLIVCCVDGEWLTRRFCEQNGNKYLCLNDKMDACLNITGKEMTVFGAVTWTCLPHNLSRNVRTGRL